MRSRSTLHFREEQLIIRIGHALHLPAAASPRAVVDKLRADQAVIICHVGQSRHRRTARTGGPVKR
ncbi:hypothetical protein [Saccharothrix sp. NRRL B-16348]|uniref:hypothetical protein n=1 Tax=Saccharothrix sp. NRRL B-16348 TaxID=1415542 RepID=UPI0012FC594C|nr:hypothetical protein [Saccharothrix sp. NRRL B-16348]